MLYFVLLLILETPTTLLYIQIKIYVIGGWYTEILFNPNQTWLYFVRSCFYLKGIVLPLIRLFTP